jgi:serine/threonine protein kinase
MAETLPVGSVLSDRYEIRKVIGQGGMGSVYLASDRRLSVKQWAVKEMVLDSSLPEEKSEIEKLFTDEAHLLAELDHPNLPKVVDFFSEGDRKYLIMEYIEGETLEKKVMEYPDPLTEEKVLHYATQIAKVLLYLHNHSPNPIIFRDLKPANILVTSEDRIKLVDFGIARIFMTGKDRDTVILGTPGYASPEQYGKAQTDQRSDIFSFGATVYFLITKEDPGKSPFHFPPVSAKNPSVSKRLEEIVLKAVNMSPLSRYQKMEDLLGELKSLKERDVTAKSASQPLVTALLPPSGSPVEPELHPKELEFGTLSRGYVRQMSFKISGDVKGSISTDRPWIKARPSSVKGRDAVVDVIVDTQSLKHGGRFMGSVVLKAGRRKMVLPVNVTVQTQPLGFWTYVTAFLLTLLTFVPLLGFLGFFFMLSLFYSCPYEERGFLSAFMVISSVVSLLWLLVIAGALMYIYLKPHIPAH